MTDGRLRQTVKLGQMVLFHGGGFTGSCYLTTSDDRPGWAYDSVRQSFRVIVPDWPGVGCSAAFTSDGVAGAMVVEALGALLQHLGRPVILLVHSMSGPFGYRLIEMHPGLVQALVAVSPEPPGNIQPRPSVLREDRCGHRDRQPGGPLSDSQERIMAPDTRVCPSQAYW